MKMKIKIQTESLVSLLEPLQSVINDSHSIPICQSVKVELKDSIITVSGTNSEIDCLNSMPFLDTKEFSFCINFMMWMTALKSIKNQEIQLSIDSKLIVIKHKNGDFQLPIESSVDFPKQHTVDLKNKVKIEGKKLKEALKIANKFVLNSDLEPMANLSIEFGKKTIVRSTNRISLYKETIKAKGDKGHVLMSGKSSTALFSLLGDEEISIWFDEKRMLFSSSNRKIIILQQEGVFPLEHFDKILDTLKDSSRLELDDKQFATSIKRTSALSNRERVMKITFDISKKSLDMMCDNKSFSTKAQEEMEAKFDKKLKVSYNPKLLTEILGVFDLGAEYYINKSNCFLMSSGKKIGLMAPMA